MRLSQFLMQDETFPISHAGWDFLVFLCYMRLHETNKQKKNTLLRSLHYAFAVKNTKRSSTLLLRLVSFFTERMLKASKSADAKGDVPKNYRFIHLLHLHSDSGCWNSFGNWFWHLIVGNMSIVLNFYQKRPFFALKNHPRP